MLRVAGKGPQGGAPDLGSCNWRAGIPQFAGDFSSGSCGRSIGFVILALVFWRSPSPKPLRFARGRGLPGVPVVRSGRALRPARNGSATRAWCGLECFVAPPRQLHRHVRLQDRVPLPSSFLVPPVTLPGHVDRADGTLKLVGSQKWIIRHESTIYHRRRDQKQKEGKDYGSVYNL